MGKLRASVGVAGNGARNWEFLSAIRGPNGPSLADDILPTIPPDLQENPGQPMGLRNGPFLLANRGRGLSKYWVN